MDAPEEKVVEIGQEPGGATLLQFASSPFAQFSECDGEMRIRLDERDRLSRELHDSTSQLLVILELQLMRLKQLSRAPDSNVFDTVLADLNATVMELHKEVRELGTSGHDANTLCDELRGMATEFAGRTGVAIQTEIMPLPSTVSAQMAHAIYRVAQEALANVSRHANARTVSLSLLTTSDSITLSIGDDGVGFQHLGGSFPGGRGIGNMGERLRGVGGKLTIENPERGALIVATFDAFP